MEKNLWTKIGKSVVAIIPLAALLVALLQLYIHREKQPAIEIKKISEIELTRPLEVAKLSSTYLYDSIQVEHLWQVSYVIKNTGDVTLLGEGFDNKNIRGNAIKLDIKSCKKLLSIDVISTNTDAVLQNDCYLKFTQWRPNEYVEILLYSDGETAPEVTISDREIENVTISNVTYSPKEQIAEKRLMDKFPKALKSTLWWITIVVEVFSFGVILVAFISSVIQYSKKQSEKISTDVGIFLWFVCIILLPLIWML